MEFLDKLSTPAFLVDLDILKRNCQNMIQRCESLGLQLRPHMKTHKTLEGGSIMTGGSMRRIAVSTVAEAEFFADGGFDDILYAYPLSHDKIKRCQHLTTILDKFCILVDNMKTLEAVSQYSLPVGKQWHVFIGVSAGYKREGLPWNADKDITELVAAIINKNMIFEGIYTHCGQSYAARGAVQIQNVVDDVTDRLVHIKNTLTSARLPCPLISLGSTPSCSHLTQRTKCLTEVHPGNYIFYDFQQKQIGSCQHGDIACRVATRVVGHYPHYNQIIVDCGFAGLSHDGHSSSHIKGYAEIFDRENLECTTVRYDRMTQELGVLTSTDDSWMNFNRFPIGSLIYLVPYHSCATAMMYPYYHIMENNQITAKWMPNRGWTYFPEKTAAQL